MKPIIISTWKHGIAANEAAYEVLKSGGNSLDAVEQGVKVSEDDPTVLSVGYGGLPDRDGRVTLDAAIMDWKARIGAVIFIENIDLHRGTQVNSLPSASIQISYFTAKPQIQKTESTLKHSAESEKHIESGKIQ